jgi:hypothetical protein
VGSGVVAFLVLFFFVSQYLYMCFSDTTPSGSHVSGPFRGFRAMGVQRRFEF